MPEVKPKNRRSKSTDYRSSVVVSPYTSLSSFPSLQGSICEINKLDGHARKYSISWLPLATWQWINTWNNKIHKKSYFIYFISTVIATCDRWPCWSHACGFVLMAFPKILFLAAFLLLLSFWVDLCHQANEEDDDEEEHSSQQPLLESSKNKPGSTNTDNFWSCCSFRGIHVGGRQKFVITVVVLIFFLMLSFAVIIWIGVGKNPICSSVAARVYVDFLASAILILGGALGCYGCWSGSCLCCMFYVKCCSGSSYRCTCSSVPSAFVLWAMRELPTPVTITQAQSRAVTFFCYGADGTQNPRHWVAATTSNNQVSKASPI
ncbi:uncharacterized protein LOC7480723 isoform X4 [Populus trichocarpa]|uniref:uncharacterized protein LOC7480723 isoform X4 n=1 Tax=Populus trichocarpa TaxID=3694 RepID=UPI0022780EA2|nr:uncharacterized protein LOC7480723 isoform X4 [Populus trichocarpa]